MGKITNYTTNKIINYLFNNQAYTPATTLYLGLGSGSLSASSTSINEPTTGGYARKAITFNGASNNTITATGTIVFNLTADFGTITNVGIFDSLTNGNLLAYADVTIPKTGINGNTFKINGSDISILLTGNINSAYANKILDFIFKNGTLTNSDKYICLSTSTYPYTEPAGNAYSEKLLSTFNVTSNTACNANDVIFDTATGNWGTITDVFIKTTSDGVLFGKALDVSISVTTNDIISFSTGNISINII